MNAKKAPKKDKQKTFTISGKKCCLLKTKYSNNRRTAILVYCKVGRSWELFSYLSVNIPLSFLSRPEGFWGDTNNSRSVVEQLLKMGVIEKTEVSTKSGYAQYSEFYLTSKAKEYLIDSSKFLY